MPNNKLTLSLGEALPFKRPLPHLPTYFGRILQVNGVDVGTRYLPGSTTSTPNNKLLMLSAGEVLPFKRPLPHLPTGFGRNLQVNGVDVGIYPDLPHVPQIINY